MHRFKAFLTVVWIAGCAGPGGGGGGGGSGSGSGSGSNLDAGTDGHATDAAIDGNMQGAANDKCANATEIGLTTMHSDVTASIVNATADLVAPCGTPGAADVFYKFTLTRRELVYADTFDAPAGTTLYFASTCSTPRTVSTTTGDALCSSGACSTSQSQVVALLDPGTHYLVYAGTAGATIHFQHAQVGSGSIEQMPQGSTSPTGTTSGFGNLNACDAGGAENAYWWMTCPTDGGGTFVASTCTGTQFDTILSLQIPRSETTMCDDDTCSFQSTVGGSIPAGAGMFVVAVDGFSQAKQGSYTLSVSRP